MTTRFRRLFQASSASCALAIGLIAGATPAFAQIASATAPNEDEAAEDRNTIIVTGTHIAREELESPMPIRIVSMEDAKNFGRNTIYDTLLLNPAMAPGLGEFNSNGQEYDQGVANINLRNMGANRSLVVVDGHRWVSGGARTSAVDLNTIPQALIDRIETVTGGAAAIYGADAVTGAVNIVMKKEMDGLKISATNGISDRGDARQADLSAATGFKFADDRARFVIGANYVHTAPLATLKRFTKRYTYAVNPANTGPNDGIPDNFLIDFHQFYRSHYPTFCIIGTAGRCGTQNGQWYQMIDNQVVGIPKDSYQVISNGDTGVQNGGPDSAFGIYDFTLLRAKSEKASAYANLAVELTPALNWNTVFGYARTYNRSNSQWPQYRDDARPTNWWGTNGKGTSGKIAMICPLLSGPISILELVTKEEWNGEEAQAGRDHRQAA